MKGGARVPPPSQATKRENALSAAGERREGGSEGGLFSPSRVASQPASPSQEKARILCERSLLENGGGSPDTTSWGGSRASRSNSRQAVHWRGEALAVQ